MRSSSGGDYHGDPSAHISFTLGTSPSCTILTSTGTAIAARTVHSIDGRQSWGGLCGGGSPQYTRDHGAYDDEPMEGLEGHLEEEDDLEKDQEVDGIVDEHLINEEIVEVVGE